jgi:feruloyl esterase
MAEPAPTSVAPTNSVGTTDPEYDLMLSLEQWVEKGIAPEMIVGSGKAPDDPTKTMSRPICPYPQVTRYKGTGDINDASFECALPPAQQ